MENTEGSIQRRTEEVEGSIQRRTEEVEGESAVEPMECFSPRSSDLLSFLFALALTVLSVVLTVIGPSGDTALEAALGRLFFGAISVWAGSISLRWLLRIRDPQPRLAITAEGIVDRISLGRPVRIPWDQIKSIEAPSNGTLEVTVRDPSLLRLNLQRRLVAKFLRKVPGTHVVIHVRFLNLPSSAIVDRVIGVHEAKMLEGLQASKQALPEARIGR